MSAAALAEIDLQRGVNGRGRSAEQSAEIVSGSGAPSRHVDNPTGELDKLARTWLDLQGTRKALAQRELPDAIVAEFDRLEQKVSRLLQRTLRLHPLWPWLSQYPGLGGAHTALVIGRIGDPRRYPGQRCSEGHYLPPLYTVGSPCPVTDQTCVDETPHGDGAESFAADGPVANGKHHGDENAGAGDACTESETRQACLGVMLPPRETTGVRSLWHWAGLHADEEGRAPRKRKGVKGDWEPRVRASVMQPGGIAEQIVRLNVPKYADIYRAAKARLILRVTESPAESEILNGDAKERAAEMPTEFDSLGGRPLRLFEADRIARKIAAKAYLGDLLVEWKRISG